MGTMLALVAGWALVGVFLVLSHLWGRQEQ